MKALLNTSTGLCRLALIVGESVYHYEWQADRQLAKGLLAFIERSLAQHGAGVDQVEAIGVYRGPGSYTGLRIGITVCNTLADSLMVPIVGATGDDWQALARQRLAAGDDDQVVLPEYGGEAHITKPRK